jgi:hypothetical protein
MTKVILSIVGVVIGLMLIADVMPGVINDVASASYSEPFVVTTQEGQTSANVTLSYANYYGDLTDLSATSDNGADTPVVLAYYQNNYVTTVAGLSADDSRILTINYVREAHQQFTGFSGLIRILPVLLIIGLIVASIWGLFSARRSRG